MVFQYLAFAAGPIAQVNLIAYTWPLIATLTILALGEAQRPFVLLSLSLVGFIGAAMIMDDGSLSLGLADRPWGYLAAIASALCMAAYTVGVGRVTATPSALLLPASLIGLAGTFLWTLWAGADWPLSYHLLLGFYLGAGPMGAGYLLWSMALKRLSAGIIANLGYATPLVSTLFLVISGERLTGTAIAGALLVVASCILISRQKRPTAKRELANAR
jgi:drug/metabolite transporter (DMT)-like permease